MDNGFLAYLVISAVSGLAASIATVLLSLRQFYQQRWWERRLDAYTAVVEALHHMSNSLDADLRASGMGSFSLTAEHKAALDAKYAESNSALLRLMDMGELLFSGRAIRTLREMSRNLAAADTNPESYSDYLSGSLDAVLSCLKEFKSIARRDLNLARGLWPFGL